MRNLWILLACVGSLALVRPTVAQEDLKKEVEDLKKQVDGLRKALEESQKSQGTSITQIGQSLKKIETQTRTVAPSPYRAEIVAPPARLSAPIGGSLQRSTLSPYLNLVRDQDNDGLVTLGINYYLGTRTEQARRVNEQRLATEIDRNRAAIITGGVPVSGHRTFFDPNYGRPVQQLYRGR